jgi:uncharacterized membrane protein
MTATRIFELLATLSAGLFAGAAVYINAVEHPARMSCGTALALTEWRPSYQRATLMQAPLAIVGLLAAIGAWATGARGASMWLAGGLLLGAVVPFTLIVTLPTNKQLLDPAMDRDLDRAHLLLQRWNRLHAVRTALGLGAFAAFVTLLSG